MLCALIMAGGRGERFWPLSTDDKPKQFLNLLGEETMIQMTVRRIQKLIPMERIFIVTGKKYVELVKEQIPLLPERNIIIEPVGKNTAPCIALSAFLIDKYYKDATIAVLPSDHLIEDEDRFLDVLNASYIFVNETSDAIVTIGMRPDRPETGYGYIEYTDSVTSINGNEIKSVHRFFEKPNLEIAKHYVEQGNFLWNGGMFIWKIKTILELTEKYLTRNYEILSEIAVAKDDFDSVLDEKYRTLDSISIDYGIMEKADNIYVIPSDFGWDDVGTWNSVERIRIKDIKNNVCSGDVKLFESSNNIILSSQKPIMVADLNNIFVIESDELILVGSKKALENIKEIKNRFEKSC